MKDLCATLSRYEQTDVLLPGSDVSHLLALGRDLLAECGRGTTQEVAQARGLLWRWLEAFRSRSLLEFIAAEGVGEQWFSLVVEAIHALNLSVGELLRRRVQQYGNRALFLTFHGEEIRQHSWTEVARRVDSIASGLRELRTDDSPIALLAPNCLDTALCDLACLTHGFVNAVIPANATVDHIEEILGKTRSRIAILRDAEHYTNLIASGEPSRTIQHIVVMDPSHCPQDPRIIPLQKLEQRGDAQIASPPVIKPDDLATIMFTSGTTGRPKGICFTHLNLVSKRFSRSLALPFVGEENVFVAYLPLYHTFGRWLEMLGTIYWGGRYAFAENPSIATLLDNVRRARATGMISVPQKWIQLRDEIARRANVETATDDELKETLQSLTGGQLRWGLSAAGYLDEEIFAFFQLLGLELMSGFGMTEATGGITMTPPGGYIRGTVGKALPGIEIGTGEDGELLIRGAYVTPSYYRDEEDADHRPDGWFHTGDIATMDREGYITLVDRKKDIYKNLKGETIAPQRIENFFSDFPGVSQAFLVGDQRPYNTLLIAPNFEHAGPDLSRLAPAELKEFFRPYVVAVNRFLAAHERVVDFVVPERGFSVEADELTAKGTFKRRIVESRHADLIEPMYRRQYQELSVGTVTVRVPHWFLRARGLTESDVTVEEDSLHLTATGDRLTIVPGESLAGALRVGSLTYSHDRAVVNLDKWLRSASLWVGNADLVAFAGPDIAQWRATGAPADIRVCPETRCAPATPLPDLQTNHGSGPVNVLMDLHAAAAVLACPAPDSIITGQAIQAVEHLGRVLVEGTFEFALFARERLAWAAYHETFEVRSLVYRTLLFGEVEAGYESTFKTFIVSGLPFLDARTIEVICEARLDDEQLSSLRTRMEWYRNELSWPVSESSREQFHYIIDLLASHGMSHPESYAAIRSELASWLLFPREPSVSHAAGLAMEAVVASFRSGVVGETNGASTVSEENIEFELGFDEDERQQILKAFATTTLLSETVYVLFGGKQIIRDDLPSAGIWISQLGGRFGSSLYHVTVETKTHERFEFDLALNRTQSPDHFRITELLRMRCADLPNRYPSIARLGGLWPELGIATREDIGGESLSAFWQRASRLSAAELDGRVRWECRHHLRLALAACVDFWKQTGSTWILASPSPRDVIIPARQVTRRVRLFNIAGRVPYTTFSELVMALYRGFYHPLAHECPSLRALLDPSMIYDAFLEVLGERPGRDAFAEAALRLSKWDELDAETREVFASILDNDSEVEHSGFRPLPLRAAGQSYRRWLSLNPAATRDARLATIVGAYRWHNLRDVEQNYPDVRFRLFRETVWADAGPPLSAGLDRAIQELRGTTEGQQQIIRRVSEIRMDVRLSEDDDYFLTWLSYPYLKPEQRARLVQVGPPTEVYEPLSTTIVDSQGETYEMRGATSPREVARLAWLMRQAGLNVLTHPEHEVLVLVNQRGGLAGGILYWSWDEEHVWIQGMVVSPNFRGRDLGRAMVEDLLSRLRGQGVRAVTVDFVLPHFWTHMGFEANAEYGGLTKILTE